MKVNDYVRTDIGEIRKVVRVTDDLYVLDKDIVFAHKDKIKKSSPNIIDVLEEHDFVQMQGRGNRFYEIESNYADKLSLRDIGWDEYEELDETNIPHIVSVITHEQMEQMKYKVGD